MKIFEFCNGEVKERQLIIDALKIDTNKKHIISFVGGGGKTSLIYELGKELSREGKKVIVTTTTRMFMPENKVILTGKREDIIRLLHSENMITAGMVDHEEKVKVQSNELKAESTSYNMERNKIKIMGLPEEIAETLIDLADFVLVEADGSRRLPLKMPAEHEPVILKGSNMVVGVCGIDAIGKTIKETCHRPNIVSEFLETMEEHIINESDVAKILLSHKGQRKNVNCDYKVIVNKVDNEERLEIGKKIFHEISRLGGEGLVLTTFKS
ncbi:selenium cofactor biosynthesis protein YqeC [Clostridium sp. C2-6-12]|uniref:selenium cofactor biosynthesis protein YqeC n=1 Tax=Clostridium sp. C2-6-12 TaxID=2698832 RepID=UPI00136A4F1D|nr:selenium cofactor biosynthesis protein YqeC [Clostridium sp. C2-6-12]